jgi:plastocyanin
MKTMTTILVFVLVAGPAAAETINPAPGVYEVTEGVEFTLGNAGASDYLFNWTDGSGSYTNISDPTLILRSGQTYTFRRITTAHPFVITDSSLPVSGTDGSFSRTTFSGPEIDAATLTPLADFTADPAPTSDAIVWSLDDGDIGAYWYTCRVTSHPGMTGKIMVEQSGVVATENLSWSTLKALYRD